MDAGLRKIGGRLSHGPMLDRRMTDSGPGLPTDALTASLARLLRPLVRLLIVSGVTFPVLAELLRELYLDVAANDIPRDARARTDSRISLLTGIHRKEIRRQRGATAGALRPTGTPGAVTLSSQIIARWLFGPPWTDAQGKPLPLPRAGPAGVPSFDALVTSVTRDVRPRAVLEEWLSQEIVAVDSDERIVLNAAAFLPSPGRAEQLFYFGRNLHDHIAAAAANVIAQGKAPFMDRSVHYDALPPAVAEQLETLGREAASRMLVDVNRMAATLADAHPDPAGPTRRVNLGVYVYVEDDPTNAPPAESPDPKDLA